MDGVLAGIPVWMDEWVNDLMRAIGWWYKNCFSRNWQVYIICDSSSETIAVTLRTWSRIVCHSSACASCSIGLNAIKMSGYCYLEDMRKR